MDAYFNTGSANFADSITPLVVKQVQATLRGGHPYTPKGSVIPGVLVPGSNGVFRAFAFGDLPEDGAVSIEDGQPDPTVETLDADFITFTGTAVARSVGATDNAQARSPFALRTVIADKLAADIANQVDLTVSKLYKAATPALFGGTSNSTVGQVAAGDKMTASLLKDAVALLRGMDVPTLANGLYAFVANPYIIRDLQADDDYVEEIGKADPKAFLNGQVAQYAGAAIINAGSRGIVQTGQGTGSVDISIGTLIGADAVFAALGGLRILSATGPDKSDPVDRRDVFSYKGFLGSVLNDLQHYRFVNVAVATSL